MLREPHNFFATIIILGSFILLGIAILSESVDVQRSLEIFLGPILGFILSYYFNVTGFKTALDKIIREQLSEHRKETKDERA